MAHEHSHAVGVPRQLGVRNSPAATSYSRPQPDIPPCLQPIASTLKAIKPIPFLVVAVVMATAQAQTLERWLLPDPDEMIKASNVLCIDQAKSALVAGSLRVQGRSRAEVLALVPEAPKALSLRVVSAMRESVEDAFDFPDLSTYTQYTFRAEACFRETLGGVRMPRLTTVRPQVEKCQQLHGPEKSNALFQCVRTVVRSAEPQQ